jgi:hypothetical protein
LLAKGLVKFIHLITRQRLCKLFPAATEFFYPHFYLQTVQMEVHLATGVMGGEHSIVKLLGVRL